MFTEVTFKVAAQKGNETCEGSNLILAPDQCKLACGILNIPLSEKEGAFLEGEPCYLGGTKFGKHKGMCSQSGNNSDQARMVCANYI